MAGIALFVLSFFIGTSFGFAQEDLKPIARFSKDSAKVGEPIKLSLSVNYRSSIRILFPDTNFQFSSFEIQKKEFYPTRTKGEISRDCVEYELTTFNLDSIQSLKLPVFQFSGNDSTGWYSNEASLKILQKFKGNLPEKPVFEQDLSLIQVAKRINYPYILIGMTVVLILILLVNFFFDRPIQKFIYLFLEKRRHNAYLKLYDKNYKQLESTLSIENVESLLVNWRRYIQKVDSQPYTSFTSIEIFKVLPDKALRDVLQDVDRWIYGGIDMRDWRFNMDYVKQVAVQLYIKKRETIRNGKFE